MPTPEQDLQQHLQGYEQFTTTCEGIELECLMDYLPAGEYDEQPYPASASCEYVILDGRDITLLLSEDMLEELAKKYLKQLDQNAENAKTERRIDALENAA